MGQVIAMTRCPFHGDTDPSLAIYENGYYCFGCKKSGKLEQWMTDLAHEKPVTQSALHTSNVVKNVEDYTYLYSDGAKEFFSERKIRLDIVKEFKIKYSRNTLLAPLYNIQGATYGKQIRFLNRKPKYRLIPRIYHKEKMYPTYSRCLPDESFDKGGFIVESVYDAMKLYQATSMPSIAILGTNMRTELLMKLATISQAFDTKWCVFFDPDAHIISRLIGSKMRAYGLQTKEILPELKPYEYSDDELLNIIEEVF
jgi:DNA primase